MSIKQIFKLSIIGTITLLLNTGLMAKKQIFRAAVNSTIKAITIDGNVTNEEWGESAKFNNLSSLLPVGAPAETRRKTEIHATYDNDFLYLAFKCYQEYSPVSNPEHKERDSRLWHDDSFEVLIQPDLKAKDYYHFIGNAKNQIFDERNRDRSYNAQLNYKCCIYDNFWSAELAIPLADINLAKMTKNQLIGFNVARTLQHPYRAIYSWNPTATLHANFGEIILSSKYPVVQITNIFDKDKAAFSTKIVNNSKQVETIILERKLVQLLDEKVLKDIKS